MSPTKNTLSRTIQLSKKLEEVLKPGLKQLDIRSKKKNKKKSVVGEIFGALPIKNHGLIEKVSEQLKYGE